MVMALTLGLGTLKNYNYFFKIFIYLRSYCLKYFQVKRHIYIFLSCCLLTCFFTFYIGISRSVYYCLFFHYFIVQNFNKNIVKKILLLFISIYFFLLLHVDFTI